LLASTLAALTTALSSTENTASQIDSQAPHAIHESSIVTVILFSPFLISQVSNETNYIIHVKRLFATQPFGKFD
jgi:hypothetical protein